MRRKNLFVLMLILIFVFTCSCSYKNPEVPAPVEKTDSEDAAATSAPENKIPEEIDTVSENTGEKKDEADAELSTAPTPAITDPEELLQAELTQTVEVSITPVPTNVPSDAPAYTKPSEEVTPVLTEAAKKNTPTKKPVQGATVSKVPTKTPTKAPTKAPTVVPTKAPTNVPTEIPEKVCSHNNWGVIYVETVHPEEGHWETKEAWDEPVYAEAYVCRCGVTELEFSEDGRTMNKETQAAFLEHTRLARHSYGVTDIIVEYIHHEATQVWVVDKLQQSSYEAIGWECLDCDFEEIW